MVSFWKTQWWRLLIALWCLGTSIVSAVTSTATADSVDGLYMLLGDAVNSFIWFGGFIMWCLTAMITYNGDRIDALQKRIEILETCAITEIEEVSKNNFIIRRRLGPDKNN